MECRKIKRKKKLFFFFFNKNSITTLEVVQKYYPVLFRIEIVLDFLNYCMNSEIIILFECRTNPNSFSENIKFGYKNFIE
jgi:hypothetical protein